MKDLFYFRMPMLAPEGGSGGSGGEGGNTGGEGKLSFDDFLKDKDNQAEFDRRMNKGIQTALANEKSRLESLADERISEADKLSKMTDEEKRAYQQKKDAEELSKREKAITKRELMAEAKNTLSDKSLPISLADILDYSDADTCKQSLETVEKAFNSAVEAGVSEKLKGGRPPKAAPEGDKKTKEDEVLSFMSE